MTYMIDHVTCLHFLLLGHTRFSVVTLTFTLALYFIRVFTPVLINNIQWLNMFYRFLWKHLYAVVLVMNTLPMIMHREMTVTHENSANSRPDLKPDTQRLGIPV